MEDPPVLRDPSQETATEESLRTAVTLRGADGTSAGTTTPLGTEALELPTAFVAMTVNEYDVPLVRPVTTHVNGFATDGTHTKPPGSDVTL